MPYTERYQYSNIPNNYIRIPLDLIKDINYFTLLNNKYVNTALKYYFIVSFARLFAGKI